MASLRFSHPFRFRTDNDLLLRQKQKFVRLLFRGSIVMECQGALGALGKARQWLSDHLAEADRSVGLPKTLRQPSLRLARCLRMQAVIRCTFGISDAQSRKTSPVQSCRWSSWVNA